jgi:hypothetical protein
VVPEEKLRKDDHLTRSFPALRERGSLRIFLALRYGDLLFWENYHPNISFSRTQTLVDGDPICDHTLTWID